MKQKSGFLGKFLDKIGDTSLGNTFGKGVILANVGTIKAGEHFCWYLCFN